MSEITKKITSIEPAEDQQAVTPKPSEEVSARDMAERLRPAADNLDDNIAFDAPSFGWVKWFTAGWILLWLAACGFILFGLLKLQTGYNSYDAFGWAGIAVLVLAPVFLIWLCGYAFKQLARLTSTAQAMARAGENLSQPDKSVAAKTKTLAGAVAIQVENVNQKLNTALGQMSAVEDVLKTQTDTMDLANKSAAETSDMITASILKQKEALSSIAGTFDERMDALSTMISSHTDKLADAARMAEQKIKEARISVEGATAKINSASDIVRGNTVQATTTLAASHEEIKSLGNIIRQRSDELDGVYKKHANDLTAMIEHLRDEQASLGANLEDRLNKMRDLSLSAQASAESLSEASSAGKATVEALAQSASLADNAVKARFKEMEDMVRYSSEHAASISDTASQRVQDSLEHTRKEIARIERDMAELQAKLRQTGAETKRLAKDQDDGSVSIPAPVQPRQPEPEPKPAVQAKPKRARLHLKPIVDDAPADQDLPHSEAPESTPEASAPKASAPEAASAPSRETQPPASAVQSAPGMKAEPATAPRSADADAHIAAPDLDLHIEPAERADLRDPVLDAIRPAAGYEQNKKPKSRGFSLRGLFGGGQDEDSGGSLDIVSRPPQSAARPQSETKLPAQDYVPPTPQAQYSLQPTNMAQGGTGQIPTALKSELSRHGLLPRELVDDGLVIEAVNTRISAGHEAMSRAVAGRIGNPVAHLSDLLAREDYLSGLAIDFATEFDLGIEQLGANREAARIRLESDAGRTYLLCDAALNYGRV